MDKFKWLAAILLLVIFSCSEEAENEAAKYYRDAYNLMVKNPDEAQKLLATSIEFARSEGDLPQLARSYHLLGRIHKNQNDFSSALKNYNEAYKFYQQVNDQKYLSDVYTSMGVIFFESYGYSQALDFYLKAIDIKREINDSLVLIQLYQNVGQTLRYQSKYDSAIEFGRMALTMLQDIDKGYSTHREYASNLYNDVGISLKENSQLEDALASFKRSMELAIGTTGENERIAKSLNNIGEIHFKQGNISLAMNFYQRAFNIMQEIKSNHWSFWRVNNNLGLAYMSQNKYDSAVFYFEQVTEEKENSNRNMIDLEVARSYRNLVTVYKRLDDKDAMIDNLIVLANSKVDVIETSLLNDRLFKQLVLQQTVHEIREKEKEKAIEVEKTRQAYIAMGSGGVFSLFIGLVLYRRKAREKQMQKREEELIRDIQNLG